MNLGIFGGTFNPPHLGHLIVAEFARDQLHADEIIFVPAANPPHKKDPSVVSGSARLQMTRLAIQDNSDFAVSDIEIQRKGISYSVDTVMGLEALHPKASLFLLIGVDNLMEFESWKDPTEILARAELVVMSRPGYSMQHIKSEFVKRAKIINVPQIGISGTDIRRRLKLGRSIRYLVPKPVEEYILRNGLYRD